MKLIAQVKLLPSEEQADALRETMETANACCQRISDWAWDNQTFRQFDLHRALYHSLREEFPLSSQVVVRCQAKVADAYKLDRKTKRTFRLRGSVAFDSRILRWKLSKQEVSIWTTAGRQTIPFLCSPAAKEMLKTQQGESDLALIDGKWFMLACCEVEETPLREVDGVLGIDLGIVNLATDSEGVQYSGEPVRKLRRGMKCLRAGLQRQAKRNKSKSAARHLRKVRRRVSRFTRATNHIISKQIVEKAVQHGKAIAMETLTGIRSRSNGFSREMRFELGNWAFLQLAQFVGYKAKRAGVPVVFVDPRNTSRECSDCGYTDKANRKSQSQFKCLRCSSEFQADFNAALNIAARAAL